MAKLPLSQTVEASLSQTSWRSSIISLLTSTAVQFLTITVLVVTPLLFAQTLPEPMSQLRLSTFVEIQPPVARGPEPPADAGPMSVPGGIPPSLGGQPLTPLSSPPSAHEEDPGPSGSLVTFDLREKSFT